MVGPRTLLVTGKTEQQWIDEMKAIEFAEEHGLKTRKIRTCYLCKRADGENSLNLDEENLDEVVLSKIELDPCEVRRWGHLIVSAVH